MEGRQAQEGEGRLVEGGARTDQPWGAVVLPAAVLAGCCCCLLRPRIFTQRQTSDPHLPPLSPAPPVFKMTKVSLAFPRRSPRSGGKAASQPACLSLRRERSPVPAPSASSWSC